MFPDLSDESQARMRSFFDPAEMTNVQNDNALSFFVNPAKTRKMVIHHLMLWLLTIPQGVMFIFGGAVLDSLVKYEDDHQIDRVVKDIDIACIDKAAMKALAKQLEDVLSVFPGVTIVSVLEEPDPNDEQTWWRNRHIKIQVTFSGRPTEPEVEFDICDASFARLRRDDATGRRGNLVDNYGCVNFWYLLMTCAASVPCD